MDQLPAFSPLCLQCHDLSLRIPFVGRLWPASLLWDAFILSSRPLSTFMPINSPSLACCGCTFPEHLELGQCRVSMLGSPVTPFTSNLHFPSSLFFAARSFCGPPSFVRVCEVLRGFISGTQGGHVAGSRVVHVRGPTAQTLGEPWCDWSVIPMSISSSWGALWPQDLAAGSPLRNPPWCKGQVSCVVRNLVVVNQTGQG